MCLMWSGQCHHKCLNIPCDTHKALLRCASTCFSRARQKSSRIGNRLNGCSKSRGYFRRRCFGRVRRARITMTFARLVKLASSPRRFRSNQTSLIISTTLNYGERSLFSTVQYFENEHSQYNVLNLQPHQPLDYAVYFKTPRTFDVYHLL